ncbi:uncharacterized protein LOC115699399 isoform X2 [Cannabis sativa]|uniref:uncharacterized protein LOC115699399 isoform X2 n=1 Tax=Cannabis sativa TaxID=3483 RepID=UPI0029C9EB38|nr:uncharacterized protein LOC115699399 isoform X2 [Cannabis sativa]
MLSFTNTRPGHKWHDDLTSSSPSSGLSPAVYSGSNLNSDAFQEELAKILVCKLWFRRSPIATGCKYLQLRVSFIVGQLFHNQGDHILDNCVLLMGFIQLEVHQFLLVEKQVFKWYAFAYLEYDKLNHFE